MDAGFITAITAAVMALGAGAKYLIDRADKKRERREVAVETLLKNRITELESQLKEKDAELGRRNQYASRIKSAAGKWREQLVANDIKPIPEDWPEEVSHDATA